MAKKKNRNQRGAGPEQKGNAGNAAKSVDAGPVEASKAEPADTKSQRARGPWDGVIGWTKSIIIALLMWIPLKILLLEAFHITSGSMENTLLVGDALFVNKALYGAEIPIVKKHLPAVREPRRSDVVIFDSIEEPGLTVVKRIVGMPGDTIAMRNNRIYVNGVARDEPFAVLSGDTADYTDPKMRLWQRRYYIGGEVETYRPSLKNWGPLVIPSDSFMMLGDNRNDSYDSRYWGFLGRDRIRGRAAFIYYSYDRDGLLPLPLLTSVRWGRLFSLIR